MDKNLKAFKELIEKYNSISIETINEVYNELRNMYSKFNSDKKDEDIFHQVANTLTGFGLESTCNLCKVAESLKLRNCENCIWSKFDNEQSRFYCVSETYDDEPFINDDDIQNTYQNIKNASNAEELLIAFRNRAKLMSNLLKHHNIT